MLWYKSLGYNWFLRNHKVYNKCKGSFIIEESPCNTFFLDSNNKYILKMSLLCNRRDIENRWNRYYGKENCDHVENGIGY